jgi:hypothetical protein
MKNESVSPEIDRTTPLGRVYDRFTILPSNFTFIDPLSYWYMTFFVSVKGRIIRFGAKVWTIVTPV